MKNYLEENYYELLELSPQATTEQIHRAYEHAKRTFSEDSLASYSLFTAEDRSKLLERIEQAYRVLMNESTRRKYDRELELAQGLSAVPSTSASQNGFCPPPVLPDPFNGKDLRRIREYQGLSLEMIASRTRIHLPYLEYIETDRYEKLPHEVYLRSYLIQYARMIGLDPARVTEGYLRNCSRERMQDPRRRPL